MNIELHTKEDNQTLIVNMEKAEFHVSPDGDVSVVYGAFTTQVVENFDTVRRLVEEGDK